MSSDSQPSSDTQAFEKDPPPAEPGQGALHTVLRVSEEQFRLLVESATEYAIFLLDTQGRVASWNRGAERINGYRAEEIIGRHFSQFYTPEDLARGHPEEELAIARVQGRYEEEGWRVRKDGSRFLANVLITALYDENGVLQGYSKITRDETDRRHLEEERLQRTREQMAQGFLRDILFSVTEGKLRFCTTTADLPPPADPAAVSFPFSRMTLAEVRRRTQGAAIAVGMNRDRWQDLLTAVGEASMNAVTHATEARACLGVSPSGMVQVRIEDGGTGIDVKTLPRATLERGFSSVGTLGHGFWLMLQTCDRLWLLTGPHGTTLVLEQDPQAAEPQWLREAA